MAARILVIDDEASLREMLGVLLRRAGYEVHLASGCRAALELLHGDLRFDAVITDLAMPDGSGMTVLEEVKRHDDATQVLMVTAYATTSQAVEAMRQGAYDYLEKPFKNDTLVATLEKAIEKRLIVEQNKALKARFEGGFRSGELVGKSQVMQRVMQLVARVAAAPSGVLVTGESGTGKELVARALHYQSPRADQPFLVVNCGALPEALMESELFGHEKGAFTGATSAKDGMFRAADEGTLFLDEIGELPLTLQVKLLRVLQERKVRPVGGQKELPVDVRVVAATNRDLAQEVAAGSFRQDLFYRLNVIPIALPPLRERPEDIPLLAEHFLHKHAAIQAKRLELSPEALRWIVGQPYPGNVRELENVIERAVTLAHGPRITLSDLQMGPQGTGEPGPALPATVVSDEGLDLDGYLADIERRLLVSALERSGGVRSAAARLLGLSFRSMRYRLAKYDLGDNDGDGERESADELEQIS